MSRRTQSPVRRLSGAGWDFPHVGVDDASRLAYTELRSGRRSRQSPARLPAQGHDLDDRPCRCTAGYGT
jgi:hypothetical protein